MKLFKIHNTGKIGYDEFDAFVLACEDEESVLISREYRLLNARPENIVIEYIGEAVEGMKAGEILGSFNAG